MIRSVNWSASSISSSSWLSVAIALLASSSLDFNSLFSSKRLMPAYSRSSLSRLGCFKGGLLAYRWWYFPDKLYSSEPLEFSNVCSDRLTDWTVSVECWCVVLMMAINCFLGSKDVYPYARLFLCWCLWRTFCSSSRTPYRSSGLMVARIEFNLLSESNSFVVTDEARDLS